LATLIDLKADLEGSKYELVPVRLSYLLE